jgi:hypothetical protein
MPATHGAPADVRGPVIQDTQRSTGILVPEIQGTVFAPQREYRTFNDPSRPPVDAIQLSLVGAPLGL